MTGCPRYPDKQRYHTYRFAEQRREATAKRYPESQFTVYLCQYCSAYHIGRVHLGDASEVVESRPLAGSMAYGWQPPPTPKEDEPPVVVPPKPKPEPLRPFQNSQAEAALRRQERAERHAALLAKHAAKKAAKAQDRAVKRMNAYSGYAHLLTCYERQVLENEGGSFWKG